MFWFFMGTIWESDPKVRVFVVFWCDRGHWYRLLLQNQLIVLQALIPFRIQCLPLGRNRWNVVAVAVAVVLQLMVELGRHCCRLPRLILSRPIQTCRASLNLLQEVPGVLGPHNSSMAGVISIAVMATIGGGTIVVGPTTTTGTDVTMKWVITGMPMCNISIHNSVEGFGCIPGHHLLCRLPFSRRSGLLLGMPWAFQVS